MTDEAKTEDGGPDVVLTQPHHYNRRAEYEKHVAPLLLEAHKKCQELRLPMVAAVQFSSGIHPDTSENQEPEDAEGVHFFRKGTGTQERIDLSVSMIAMMDIMSAVMDITSAGPLEGAMILKAAKEQGEIRRDILEEHKRVS